MSAVGVPAAPVGVAATRLGLAAPSPSRASDPSRPPAGIEVRGGAGGTTARLEDLTWAAGRLDAAHEALASAVRLVADLLDGVDDAAIWSPETAPGARRALREAGPGSIRGAAERSGDLADDLRAAVRVYDGADEAVRSLLSGWFATASAMAGRALGEAGPVAWVGTGIVAAGVAAGAAATTLTRLVGLRLLSRSPTPVGIALGAGGRWLATQRGPAGAAGRLLTGPGQLPGFDLRRLHASGIDMAVVERGMPFLASFVTGALPGRARFSTDPVRDAAAAGLVGGTIAGVLLGRAPSVVMVAPVIGRPREKEVPPRDAEDLLEGVAALYESGGGDPGTIAVTRLDQPDGTVSWVVSVPGTQAASLLPGGRNPFDLRSDLQPPAELPADVARAVVQAMTQAGVKPGDAVTMVGHSLGGMGAAQLVADPSFQAKFDVDVLLTAGSPVGDVELPPDVVALHLEHRQDAVPAVDATPNPDTRSRTTVTRDLGRPSSLAAPDRLDVAGTHAIGAYVETARVIEDSPDRSLAAARGSLGAALGDPDAVATTTVYQAVRVPVLSAGGRR